MVILKIWFIWPDFHFCDCLSWMCSGRACFSQDKTPKLQWMLSTHQTHGLALALQTWTSASLGVPKRDASSPFALCIASICLSRWFDLFSPRFLCEGNSLPWSKKKTPVHSHIPSVLMYVLCQAVKLSCVTVYTSARCTGLGCKRNVLISVPFANRGKLLHMSSGSEILV